MQWYATQEQAIKLHVLEGQWTRMGAHAARILVMEKPVQDMGRSLDGLGTCPVVTGGEQVNQACHYTGCCVTQES